MASDERMDTTNDFVIRGHDRDLVRFHATKESLYITATEPTMQRQVIIADASEAIALRNWLSRQIDDL